MGGGKEQTNDCLGFFAWEQSCFLPEGERETLAVDDVSLTPFLTGIEDDLVLGQMEIRINALRGLEKDFFDDGFSDFDELADEDIKLRQVARTGSTSTYSFDINQPFSQKLAGVKSIKHKAESLWLKVLDTQKEYVRDNELKLKVLVGIFPLQLARDNFVELRTEIQESLPIFDDVTPSAVVAGCCGLLEPYMLLKNNEVTAKGKLCAKIALRQADGEYTYMDAEKNVEWQFPISQGTVADLKDVCIRVSQLAYREEGWFKVEGEAVLPVVLEEQGAETGALETRIDQGGEPQLAEVTPPEPEDMKDDFKVDWLQDWAECKDLNDCKCAKADADQKTSEGTEEVTSEWVNNTRAEGQDETGELANEIEEDLSLEAGARKIQFMEVDGDLEPVLQLEEEEFGGEKIQYVQPLTGGSDEVTPVLEFEQLQEVGPEPGIEFAVPLQGREDAEELLSEVYEEVEEVPQLTSLVDELDAEASYETRAVEETDEAAPEVEAPALSFAEQPELKENTKRTINYVQDKPARLQLNPEQATWKFYFVKPGETIESISEKVGVRVEEILARNRLSRVTIEQSKVIMIPVLK